MSLSGLKTMPLVALKLMYLIVLQNKSSSIVSSMHFLMLVTSLAMLSVLLL